MGSQKPIQHRPIATVPENQLEQAVSAMEVLGSLQHPTLLQQMPERPVTGRCSWHSRSVLAQQQLSAQTQASAAHTETSKSLALRCGMALLH